MGKQAVPFDLRSEQMPLSPLVGADVFVHVHDMLSIVRVTHRYRNAEDKPIEAVFTFPIPFDGTFLDLQVKLGERCLKGTVVEKKEAENRYEKAIGDGDAAVLLQELEPGLYAINVGNLKGGEEAEVCFRYAVVNRWQGDLMRFLLPTVVAPRFGKPTHEPFLVPEIDLLACNEYTLDILITGKLADADIECPSHEVRIIRETDRAHIRPEAPRLAMDRDFVLNFRKPGWHASGLWSRVEDGIVAMAAFTPRFSEENSRQPRVVKIVCDCSDSMAGDSILQARQALELFLNHLCPEDRFTIIRFGSHHTFLFPELRPADSGALDEARRLVRRLQADMGGTEIGSALQAAFTMGPEGEGADVLLITDGEVWNQDRFVEMAIRSNHRIFVIGVGSAASEATLQRLARETGGACELVSPYENMREAVIRHVRRIWNCKATTSHITWPVKAGWSWPEHTKEVFDGDTVLAFAWTKQVPWGAALLVSELEDGRRAFQECLFAELPPSHDAGLNGETLLRIAVARRIKGLNSKEAREMALRYGVLCEHTHFLLVHERKEEEKADSMPMLRKVPHMLAAGWGGIGSVHYEAPGVLDGFSMKRRADMDMECTWMSLQEPSSLEPRDQELIRIAELIEDTYTAAPRRAAARLLSVDKLCAMGLGEGFGEALRKYRKKIEERCSGSEAVQAEEVAVLFFLMWLMRQRSGRPLSRKSRDWIRRAYKRRVAVLPIHDLERQAWESFDALV